MMDLRNVPRGLALLITAALTLVTTSVHAQQIVQQTLLPDSTIQRVIAVYNRSGTTRMTGDSRLSAGSTLTGDVAAINGTLEIGGHVTGDVVVINGDAHILSTGVVDGSVTVAGGSIHAEPGGTITKAATAYREMLRVRDDGDQIAYVEPADEPGITAGRAFGFGRTDLLIAVHGAYNRVEGLPIAFGPRITIGTHDPTRIQALVTYRTTTGFDVATNQLGYMLGAERWINDFVRIDASLFRDVAMIQDWNLSNREASLAAFVLHQDYRDHYVRRGWSVGAHFQQPASPLKAGLTYRAERDTSAAARDPFAILHNHDAWRPEPLVAEGTLHTLTASASYDTRNDAADPTDGWMITTSLERGLGGSLTTPAAAGLTPQNNEAKFTFAAFDVRRYARFTPYSRLAVRIFATGSLGGDALPAQRQLALGGEGSLPGYPLDALNCGANRTVVTRSAEFAAFHGCDRLALAQLEYQASFPLARKLGEKLRLGNWLTNSVRWAAFFDAGRAWNDDEALNGRARGRNDFSADTGLGLRLGPVGLYWAVPLSGSMHKYNVFMRLGPRI